MFVGHFLQWKKAQKNIKILVKKEKNFYFLKLP